MTRWDVFNGDADGLCALQQLHLAEPREAVLVTGVKRDIALLGRVAAQAGDRVTVLDVSMDSNREALMHLLASGVELTWFDHHHAGEIPTSPLLHSHIDTSPEVCTSSLVDLHLGGRYRPWAVTAAFGDNLPRLAHRLADSAGLDARQRAVLEQLGRCLNYNAYGESVADLHFDPVELFAQMRPYGDPFSFADDSSAFLRLAAGYRDDMAKAAALVPHAETADAALFVLPDAAWARRVSGVLANDLALAQPDRAHAILSPRTSGGYTVSVRAPHSRPTGADALCRQFEGGGGRQAAAGVNDLPADQLESFGRRFVEHFARRS